MVGRYSSVDGMKKVFRRNHPVDWLSTSPLFNNAATGRRDRGTIPFRQDNPFTIGHDVYIGQEALFFLNVGAPAAVPLLGSVAW